MGRNLIAKIFGCAKAFISQPTTPPGFGSLSMFLFSLALYTPNSHVNSDDKCILKGLKMHHGYWPAVSYMNC